tara:strand:+ start:55 stop:1479 length:1425 start_codon:yes stop_codon:yes gene_type:complete
MASLIDFLSNQKLEPGGYRFNRGTSSTGPYLSKISDSSQYGSYRDRAVPNYAGSSNAMNQTGSGRSNLDAQRGYSTQGIAGIASNRQPAFELGLGAAPNQYPLMDDSDDVRASSIANAVPSGGFTDEGLVNNVINDATTMARDLTPNVNFNFPGLGGGVMNLVNSIANNQRQHKFINDLLGRASPAKNEAFYGTALANMQTPNAMSDATTMALGDTSKGTSLGQATKYFKMAGLTDNQIEDFFDANNDKGRFMNENYLRSMSEDKDMFDTGVSFIKNAKATANLARNLEAAQNQMAMEDAVGSDRQPAFELGLGAAPDQYPIQASDRQPAFELGLGQAPDQYPLEDIVPSDRQPAFDLGLGGAPDQYPLNPLGPEYDVVMDIMPNEQEYIDINPEFYQVTGRQSNSPLAGLFGNNLTSQMVYGNFDDDNLPPGVRPFVDANEAASFITDELNEGNPNSIRSRRFYDSLIPASIY